MLDSRKMFSMVLVSSLFFVMEPLFAQETTPFPQGALPEVVGEKVRKDALESISKAYEQTQVLVPEEPEEKLDEEIDDRSFFVESIYLEGDLLIPESDYRPIIKPYESREITLTQLKSLMDELEAIFRSKGYFAVVTIPPQRMTKPEIHLKVIVSKMGQLSVEGNRHYKDKIIRRYWSVREGDILRYDAILESTQAVNANPNRTVKPILKAGEEFRTTDIVLQVEDRLPIHANFTWDNQGVKLTGKERYGFQVRHDNFLGQEDIFLAGTTFGTRFGAFYMNYIYPITAWGTQLVAGFSHAQTNPKKEFEPLGINGISQTYSLGVKQKVIQRQDLYGEVHLNFSFKEKSTRVLSVTTAWDKMRVLDFGGTLQKSDKNGFWLLYQDFVFGMPNRGDGWPLASRQGEHSFFKYSFLFKRNQKMIGKTRLLLSLEAQLTPDRLLPQEQYYLGGARTVRGYPESDFAADQFILAKIEYQIPLSIFSEEVKLPYDERPLSDRFRILTFFDQGYGRNQTLIDNEKVAQHLMGMGAGVEFEFRENIHARVEWGWRIGAKPENESGRDQIHFSVRSSV